MDPPPPSPARFILPVCTTGPYLLFKLFTPIQFIHSNEWRDTAGVNAPLMRVCFPSTTIEMIDFWEDLARLDRTFVFDRAIILSRETSGRQYVLFLPFLYPFHFSPAVN